MSKSGSISAALAAYSLGAIGENEGRAIRDALASDRGLRLEARAYEQTAARLVSLFRPIPPDESVWENIEAAISVERPHRRRTARRHRSLLLVGVVAAAAFFVGGFVATAIERSSARSAVAAAAADLAAEPTATTLSLSDPVSGAAVATMVVGADGTAIFSAAGLFALDADLTYQLWAVVDGSVVSAGLLGPDPGAVPLRLEADPEALAVTVEIAGGVVTSEHDPVAVWTAGA
jgi:anti-sigma-K factor RskA